MVDVENARFHDVVPFTLRSWGAAVQSLFCVPLPSQ